MKPGNADAGINKAKLAAWFIGAAGTFLLVGGLAWWIFQRTQPAGVDLARAKLRFQYLAEVQAEAHKFQTTSEVLDKAKGIYRIPITNAVEVMLRLWQDPAAGRSNLLSRIDKATAKPPEKPNEYE